MGSQDSRSPSSPLPALRNLSERSLTLADLLTVPLWSIDRDLPAPEAAAILSAREFDIAGVAGRPVSHYVTRERLESCLDASTVVDLADPILAADLVEKSLPLADLVRILGERTRVFVLDGGEIRWIATTADLQAPAVSVVVLSYLLAIEIALSDLVPQALGDRWFMQLAPKRRVKVLDLYESKRHHNVATGIEECLYFGDWLQLVGRSDALVRDLGFASKSHFGRKSGPLADLRNTLAHGGTVLDSQSPAKAIAAFARVRALAEQAWGLLERKSDWWGLYERALISTSEGLQLAGPVAVRAVPHDLPAHVLTAWNPGSLTQSDTVNRAANARLSGLLRGRGFVPTEVLGSSPDGSWSEASILVSGMSRSDAAAIGAEFGQRSVFELTEDELIVVNCGNGGVVRHRPRRGI